jgi:hypothetical protein
VSTASTSAPSTAAGSNEFASATGHRKRYDRSEAETLLAALRKGDQFGVVKPPDEVLQELIGKINADG